VTATLKNRTDPAVSFCSGRKLVLLLILTFAVTTSTASPANPQAAKSSASLSQIQRAVERGELETAEKQLWEIVTAEPENARAINLLGKIRMQQKRFPEAEALFKRVLAILPDFTLAQRNLGDLYLLQGRHEEAEAAYQKAHELDPRDVKTSLALGTVYEQTGKFERSIEIINSIPADARPSTALPVLASDYLALRQPDKLAALAPLVLRGAPSDPTLIPRFARVLAENGYVDDASELLKSTPERQKLTVEYLLVLSRVQEGQGNLAQAERTLSRVTTLNPKLFEPWFQLARLASQAKDYKKEAALLIKALEIQPDHIEALRHLVLARMRSGEALKAATDARRLYSLQPEDPDTVYLLGAALANHAEWHEARPIMEKLVAVRDNATSHVMFGMTLLNDGDIEAASQQIERALQQNPNEVEGHYYKGVIARQRGDLAAAINDMEFVVKANPQHTLAQVELGTLSLQTGNLDRARQAFEQAVVLSPEVPENHYQLGIAYSRLGLQDKARVQMAEFQKLKEAADHSKASGSASGDRPAENKPPAGGKPR
jgi:tetratricopeptide (TPR) repeat protein